MNWIDNQSRETKTLLPVINPATGQHLGHAHLAEESLVEAAVQSSHAAFASWSAKTIKDRVSILIKFHQLVIKHKEEIAALISAEHGKTIEEALAEVAKGNETVEYAFSLPLIYPGSHMEYPSIT